MHIILLVLIISIHFSGTNSTTATKRTKIDNIEQPALRKRITDNTKREPAEGDSSQDAALRDSNRTTKCKGKALATRIGDKPEETRS
ncbi:hypothetical protein KEM48_006429 [Puccinia striiformis f. sp. tritici PST-130]|nr:hypothetical protein KEM48_006429 [Puccinia striiformis f. sp. tritici PST-130]